VRELKLYGQPTVVIALAANKSDLEQYRVVSEQEGRAYARDNDMSYFETSAKDSRNVRKMFVELGAPPPSPARRPARRPPRVVSPPRVRSAKRAAQGGADRSGAGPDDQPQPGLRLLSRRPA